MDKKNGLTFFVLGLKVTSFAPLEFNQLIEQIMKVIYTIAFAAAFLGVSVNGQSESGDMPQLDGSGIRLCSVSDPCGVCQGTCRTDDDCMGALVCYEKDRSEPGSPESQIPGCAGESNSATNWCIIKPVQRSTFQPGKDQTDYQKHYLVGILNYPNADIPDILSGHTSGTALDSEQYGTPYDHIPSVGFSDIEPFIDEDGAKVVGEFLCLSDNGYGSSSNSADYALNIVHMSIQKPFTYLHGESTFEKYTPTTNLNTVLIHDPDNHIIWENGADIQVAYHVPDDTWGDYKELRVLTGRDFDVEGLAVISHELAIVGDELMPAIFAINPSTGVVLTPFVRTPDIDEQGNFNGNYLSTRGDKVHVSTFWVRFAVICCDTHATNKLTIFHFSQPRKNLVPH